MTTRGRRRSPKPAAAPFKGFTMAYNGWENYETWATALWIDNDQELHLERHRLAQAAWDEATDGSRMFTREQNAVSALAGALSEWVEGMAPELGACLFSDLLNAALAKIDWHGIAEHWIKDVDRERIV